MSETIVVNALEQLKPFLNDRGVLELVVRDQKQKYKAFQNIMINELPKVQENEMYANVIQALNKNTNLNVQNLKQLEHIANLSNVGLLLNGLNLCATCAGFAIMYAKLDKMSREIVYIPLSSILEVNTPAGSMRLGDTFGYYSKETDPNGFSYLIGKVEFLTGLTVDSYLAFNVTEIPTILSSLGNVTIQLPCSVYNNGSALVTILSAFETSLDFKGEIETVFSSGSVRLTPETVLPLFTLTERFSGDIANKTQIETTPEKGSKGSKKNPPKSN